MKETKCYCGHTTYCDCGPEESINYRQTGASEFVAKTIIKNIIIQKEEPKQETLEEAAERLNPYVLNGRTPFKEGFKEGAKWQQERSYSEEDMKIAFKIGFSIGHGSPVNGLDSKDEICDIWFEIFHRNK